jgi:hypothetical protein
MPTKLSVKEDVAGAPVSRPDARHPIGQELPLPMSESTTFSNEEARKTGEDLSSFQTKRRQRRDISVAAISGEERGSTTPSACAAAVSETQIGGPNVRYVQHPGITREAEVETLAHIYDFVIRAYEKRNAAETDNGSEGEEAAERNRTGIATAKRRS